MSRLLENIIKNRGKNKLQEIDMTKSSAAMMRHLGRGFQNEIETVPIDPEPASWQSLTNEDGRYVLNKSYELEDVKFLLYFVNELIHLSEKMNHHPEILINHNQATINLYTRDLNDVTDRDIEMSKKIDEIIEDVNVIRFRK